MASTPGGRTPVRLPVVRGARWALATALVLWLGVAGSVAVLGFAPARDVADVVGTERVLFVLLGLALASSIGLALFLQRAEVRATQTADALRDSEERYRRFFEGTRAPLLVVDPGTGAIVEANGAAAEFYGWPLERLRAMTLFDLAAGDAREDGRQLAACAAQYGRFESVHRHADGRTSSVEVYAGPYEAIDPDLRATRRSCGPRSRCGEVRSAAEGPRCELRGRQRLFAIVHDVTERRRLAERLRAAEKMEALGRMAGGVAHDMNNLLTIVLGNAQLARGAAMPGGAVSEALSVIERSVEHGAALTHTLLSLGHGRSVERVPLDLRNVLADAEPSLRAVVRDEVRLELSVPGEEIPALVDPAQIRQALAALVENAAEAIEGPGIVRVTAAVESADRAAAEGAADAGPGPWAVLRVTDSGTGIRPEVRRHLFEPFFTTKPRGRGRGLGLATVYGTAMQSGGTVTVETTPGTGSTFTIWLPRPGVLPQTAPSGEGTQPVDSAAGRARFSVLLAEDDPELRVLFSDVLTATGWDVRTVSDGIEALELWRASEGEFAVVVTDVVMPRLGGPRLAERLLAERPALPVVFITGWADEAPPARPDGAPRVLLRKPFRPSDLVDAVARILGRTPEVPASAPDSRAPRHEPDL